MNYFLSQPNKIGSFPNNVFGKSKVVISPTIIQVKPKTVDSSKIKYVCVPPDHSVINLDNNKFNSYDQKVCCNGKETHYYFRCNQRKKNDENHKKKISKCPAIFFTVKDRL